MGEHAASRLRGRVVIAVGLVIGLVFGLAWWGLASQRPTHRALASAGPVVLPPITGSATDPGPAPAETANVVVSPPPLPDDGGERPPAPAPPRPSVAAATTPSNVTTAPKPPARLAATLIAHYVTRPGAVWNVGYVADVTVTNASAGPVAFEVRLDLPPGVDISNQVWNASVDRRTGPVTFRGGPVAPGQRIIFGFVADKNPALTDPRQFEPRSCTVNGLPCS